MEVKSQRRTFAIKLDEVETAIADAHMKLGQAIASMRQVGLAPNRNLMCSYDSLLAASNSIRDVKSFIPTIVFADEVE